MGTALNTIRTVKVPVVTGNTSQTSEHVVSGIIRGVVVNHTGSDATADITIAGLLNGVTIPILTLTDNNTDGFYTPVVFADDAATGADIAVATGVKAPHPIAVNCPVTVTVAQNGASDTVEVWLLVE